MPQQRPYLISRNRFEQFPNEQKYAEYLAEFMRASSNGTKCGALYKVIQWLSDNPPESVDIPVNANREDMRDRINEVRQKLVEAGMQPIDINPQAMGCNICYHPYNTHTGMIALDCGHHLCDECFLKIFDEVQQRSCALCRELPSSFRWMYV